MEVNVRDNLKDVLAHMRKHKQEVVDKAIPRALNRAGEMAMTAASREIRAQGYNFKAGEIKEAMRMSQATRARLVTTVRVRRQTKSLLAFGAVQTKAGVRVKVHGQVKVIKGAFIAQLRNGRQGVYVEDKTAGKTTLRMSKTHGKGSVGGWQAYPVRKLYGPSVGGVYGTDRIQSVIVREIGKNFRARLAHEMRHLMR